MKTKWLIEDYEGDGSLDAFIAEVKSQGMEYDVIKYFPFECGEYNNFHNDDCVIFYGSLNLAAQLQRQKPWIPGPICNFKNLHCLAYYSHWGHYLFNNDYIMLPLLELSRRRNEIYEQFGIDDCIFMRPDSGSKAFCGNIYPMDELDHELKLMDGYASRDLDDIMVVVSSPKVITREWRIVVVPGYGPIAASQYKKDNILDEQEGAPVEVMDIAKELSMEIWQPDKIYVIDVCESNGEFGFLEANSFSCSGLYKCDLSAVVSAASDVAANEHMEYNQQF